MTVTTTVSSRSGPRARRSRAQMAMRWSPSTTAPVWSTAMSRSASPSKARPASAPASTTARRSASGWVAPQRSLMLQPSGWSLMTVTSAPRRSNASGADGAGGAVGAVEHDRQAVEARRPSSDAGEVLDVPRRRRRRSDDGADAPRPTAATGSATSRRSSSASMRLLDVVGQLAAARREQLDAVVGEGVVRRRDHRARHALGLRRRRPRRRRQDAEALDVDALGGEAGGQRRLEQRARDAGVAARRRPARRRSTRAAARPEGEGELGGQLRVGDAADAVGAEAQRHGRRRPDQRFEYCGALRAFLRPYFLLSFSRASRVRRPAFFRVGRSSGSSSTSARAMPMRRAPA